MPIDTAPKRLSAIATRRLPWFRRFALPAPDSAVDQGDRQQLALVYRGVLAGEVVEPDPVGTGWCANPVCYVPGGSSGVAFIPGGCNGIVRN